MTDPHLFSDYLLWLQGFQKPLDRIADWHELAQSAYEARHSRYLRVDFDPTTGEPVRMENETRTAIRHCVGRLCGPRRAARVLTHASMSHSHFFCDFTLEREDSKGISHRPGPYKGLTVAGISGRIFPGYSSESNDFYRALQILDVLDIYKGKDWQPRVHAELALLEALYDKDCKFFNDDKYIACSKAACFC